MSPDNTMCEPHLSRARLLCPSRDYRSAIEILTPSSVTTESQGVARLEIARIYLIQGNRRRALETLIGVDSGPAYQDLLTIMRAFMHIGLEGNLEKGLVTAVTLWHKYEPTVAEEGSREVQFRILYYCIEIVELWKLYGEGHHDPEIEYSNILDNVTHRLLEYNLFFEAFELMQFMSETPASLLEAHIATVSGADRSAMLFDCILRLAQVQASSQDVINAQQSLHSLHPVDQITSKVGMVQKRIALRFLENDLSRMERVKALMELGGHFWEIELFDEALKCYEDAAELHCELPVSKESYNLGMELHDREKELCEQSGDLLSLLQFEFRRCDMICSLTGRLRMARELRSKLLLDPIASKLPFFEKHHRRQCLEFSVLFQRGEALYHAEKYLDFCKRYKTPSESSYANALRLNALSRPSRMSDEAREALLEDIRDELKVDVTLDRKSCFDIALLRKLVLWIAIERELYEMQRPDPQEYIALMTKLLDEAEALGNKIQLDDQDLCLRYELGISRCEFETDFEVERVESSFTRSLRIDPGVGSQRSGFVAYARAQGYYRRSFQYSQYMYNLALVMRSDSEAQLIDFMEAFRKEDSRLANEEGHSLEQAEFFVFRGFLYFSLSHYAESVLFDIWKHSGLRDAEHSLQESLTSFDLALQYDERHWNEVHEKQANIETLSARQSYVTRSTERLVFSTALTICHQLEDLAQTWSWIQKSKAQGFQSMLFDHFVPAGNQFDGCSRIVTFEDMLWVSTACAERVIFVDWAQYSESFEKLMLVALWFEKDSEGYGRKLVQFDLDLSTTQVRSYKARLNSMSLDSSTSRAILLIFEPLVACLKNISSAGDILILCPTGPLHNIPLHAIEMDGQPLMKRNPLLYIPSLSVLVMCLKRLEGRSSDESGKIAKIAITGAYETDIETPETIFERSAIYASLDTLARCLVADEALVGTALTRASIQSQAAGAGLLHFHGHGHFDEHVINNQALILGGSDEVLSLSDMSGLALDRAHVTVVACEGAVQDYSMGGDEPFGLIPALFLGGATSILAVLWPIPSTTGRLFTQEFYGHLLHPEIGRVGPISQLAVALQRACMTIRNGSATKTPYHWAGFVLYGVCTWLFNSVEGAKARGQRSSTEGKEHGNDR